MYPHPTYRNVIIYDDIHWFLAAQDKLHELTHKEWALEMWWQKRWEIEYDDNPERIAHWKEYYEKEVNRV